MRTLQYLFFDHRIAENESTLKDTNVQIPTAVEETAADNNLQF